MGVEGRLHLLLDPVTTVAVLVAVVAVVESQDTLTFVLLSLGYLHQHRGRT